MKIIKSRRPTTELYGTTWGMIFVEEFLRSIEVLRCFEPYYIKKDMNQSQVLPLTS